MSAVISTTQPVKTANVPGAVTMTMWSALAVLLLTTVHHVYGAYIYDTPWRHHMAIVAALTAAVLVGSLYVLRRRPGSAAGRIAFWVFAAVTFVIPVDMVGISPVPYEKEA